MRWREAWMLILLMLCWAASTPAWAQRQHFRIGGGAGFASFEEPELDLGRGANVGGFFALRFNDNLSLETALAFSTTEQRFDENGNALDDSSSGVPAFETDAKRYHLDLTFLYNLGRRQAFHPFLFGGAGIVREEETITDFIVNPDLTVTPVLREELQTYRTTINAGGGFDFYVLHNVAARFEWRWWIPPRDTDRITRRLFFAATYFF